MGEVVRKDKQQKEVCKVRKRYGFGCASCTYFDYCYPKKKKKGKKK
jgi:hypothetical protein